MEIIFLIGLVALIAFNAYASHQCYQDIFSSRRQRLVQIAFIWLIPVIGASLALHFSRKELERSTGTYREEPNMGDDFAASGKLNPQGYISSLGDNAHSNDGADVSPN